MAFAFDGTSSHRVGGAEIVSYGPDGTDVSISRIPLIQQQKSKKL